MTQQEIYQNTRILSEQEQLRLQQQQRESEQKFRLLADAMPQHIWTSDAEGNINFTNRSILNYTGLTHEQIVAKGWLIYLHPDEEKETVKAWKNALSTGNEFTIEHRLRRHDGEYLWHLSRCIPQKDANDRIQMWVGSSSDIQEQKTFTRELERQVQQRTKELELSNNSLRNSEQRYHLMVEEVQDYAILYLNREGIIENWNKGAEKIKGYKAEEIIGKSFSVFYTEKDRKEKLPFHLLKKASGTGRAVQEGWRVRKDGSEFWASVVITAVHNTAGEVIGFSKVTHDLTEKKKADDRIRTNAVQLEEKNRELEKMNAELQSFAYVSSHDLQEPLRKIQTMSDRILEKEQQNLSDYGKDYFARMQNAAKRMQTLIHDLLAYSRTNSTERVFVNTDLNIILEDVKSELREALSEKNAVIDSRNLCEARIIQFQFRQMLLNLLSNSLKFARPGVPSHIIIKSEIIESNGQDSLTPEVKYCHITYSDNGIGFEQEYSNLIFQVFQRLHGKNEYSGTGIGLAIVKKIVENHNGIITARGEPNKGARFDIYIPV